MKNKLLILLAIIAISCNEVNPYQEKYCGKEIVSMGKTLEGNWIKIRQKETISNRIYLTQYDWGKFQIGDTIPCLNHKP